MKLCFFRGGDDHVLESLKKKKEDDSLVLMYVSCLSSYHEFFSISFDLKVVFKNWHDDKCIWSV